MEIKRQELYMKMTVEEVVEILNVWSRLLGEGKTFEVHDGKICEVLMDLT